MPKIRDGQDVQAFQHVTCKYRKGAHGFRSECVPEMTAWLLLQSMSYDRLEQSIKRGVRGHTDEYVQGMLQYCNHAQSVLKALLSTLEHGWERCYWNEACGKVADQLGIVYGESLPDNLTDVSSLLPDVKVGE